MKIDSLEMLLEEELKDIYNAEKQLVKALPKMAKAANADNLRQGFEDHLQQTEGHVQRLEQIFGALGVAGGVLLGRTVFARQRKILGIPLPNKVDIDLGGIGQSIGDAGRQLGKLAGEVRVVRERAEQLGKALK